MSTFGVHQFTLTVSPHPDPEVHSLDLVHPQGTGYQAISQRGRFVTGDKAIYVPEPAKVPERVLRATGFWDDEAGTGMLSGSDRDIVKALRLRGIFSQGILIHPDDALKLTDGRRPDTEDGDWAELLGITKHVPPIPPELQGKIYPVDGLRSYTDIENFRRHSDVLEEGEEVVMTEKLHGSMCLASLRRDEDTGEWTLHVSSKRTGRNFAMHDEEDNLYWRAIKAAGVPELIQHLSGTVSPVNELTVFGEVLGIQDLKYGYSKGEPGFRAFEVRVDGNWLNAGTVLDTLKDAGFSVVPVLYRGPFSVDVMWEHAEGKTTDYTGEGKRHIREGVVVRPVVERSTLELSRVILKAISTKYLTRKGGTEFE